MLNSFVNVHSWVDDPIDITEVSCLLTATGPVYNAPVGHICRPCYLLLDEEHQQDFNVGPWHSMVLNALAKDKSECYLCSDLILLVRPCINCDICVDEYRTIRRCQIEEDGEVEMPLP